MLNSVYFLDTERLPISLTETTTWSIKNIPIIGAFLNILTLGIPIGWNNTDVILEAKKINGLIPTNLYDLGVNGELISTKGALAMDLFRNDTSDSIGALTGTNNITSAIRFSLTDKVKQGGILHDTLDLGQDVANGWKMDENAQPNNPLLASHEGFILDLINIKFIGKCDYTITAFSKGAKIYESKYQSKSKFSEAAREWSNTIKLSNWAEINNKTIPYPEAITPPTPALIEVVEEVDLNLESTVGTFNFYQKIVDRPVDDPRNIHSQNDTFTINIKEFFGANLGEIVAKGYRTATLIYDLKYQLTTDKINNNNYLNQTPNIDLTNIGDIDKLKIDKVFKKLISWTWGDYGTGTPDVVEGDVLFKSDLDFEIDTDNSLLIKTQLLLDCKDYRYGSFQKRKEITLWKQETLKTLQQNNKNQLIT